MAATRRVISVGKEHLAQLETIARSRTAPASRVERARILLAYRSDPSAYAVGEAVGVTRQTVKPCLNRAVRLGAMGGALRQPAAGQAPAITADAKAWLVSLACQKAKDLGNPHELWTTLLLARHAREHAEAAGHNNPTDGAGSASGPLALAQNSQLPKKVLRQFADTRHIDQASMIGATDADDFRCRCEYPPNFTDLAKMKKGLFIGLEDNDRTEILAYG